MEEASTTSPHFHGLPLHLVPHVPAHYPPPPCGLLPGGKLKKNFGYKPRGEAKKLKRKDSSEVSSQDKYQQSCRWRTVYRKKLTKP
eukprot:636774-Pelagomonas_calceolata.AAC.1